MVYAENWVPATVPNGPGDIATIGRSSITAIVMPEQSVTELDSVIFEVGASITIPSGASLTFEGAGAIADGVGVTISSQSGSSVAFHNSSVCEVYLSVRGQITFDGQATVSKSITCYGGDSTDEEGAVVFFLDQSAVTGYDMIVNDGIFGGKPSKVYFNDDSKADNVFFIVNGQGTVDISGHNPPGLAVATAGYFGGVVFLGSNNLTVTKNYQGSFSGLIQDDGLYGGSGGSLTKAGTSDDTLSLLSENTYTGGTVIEGGTLLVGNKHGSATGLRPVQLNGGALGGTGTIVGSVTIGSGTGNTATLFGGSLPPRGGKLTLKRSLTFASDGLYLVKIDGLEARSTSVSAGEVIIDGNARIKMTDQRRGTMAAGTTLTLIDNTGERAIDGTFKKLPDGGNITVGLNTFKVSYSGGDGNDLTLTVVP